MLWSATKKGLKVILVLFLIVAVFIGGIGGGMLSGYISTTSPLEIIDLKSSDSATVIYDNKGLVVQELTGASDVNREYVSITRMKPTYIDDASLLLKTNVLKIIEELTPNV